MSEGALTDLKVLEFGNLVSAPYCGKLMADLGAEVIKIEEPEMGDEARSRGPFAQDVPGVERSGLFAYLNTNKLSVTLNPRNTLGKAIFEQLVRHSDILVENQPPRLMEELGFTYETLEKINPRLIMTSITPFGQTGPHRDYKAYELTTYNGCGYGFISTVCITEPVMPPVKAGGRQSEFGAAQAAAVATMCAVHVRDHIGAGQHIDVSIQELMAGQYESAIQHWTLAENEMGGLTNPILQPMIPLECKDGWIFLMCVEDNQFDRLVEIMGNPEWAKDERFADSLSRWNNQEELDRHIEEWTISYTQYEVTEMLQKVGVAAFPCLSNRGLVEDPHLNDRGFFYEDDHPEIGKRKYDGLLWKMSKTPGKIRHRAPLVGEHNNHVFGELLGLPQNEIDRLVKEKVIY